MHRTRTQLRSLGTSRFKRAPLSPSTTPCVNTRQMNASKCCYYLRGRHPLAPRRRGTNTTRHRPEPSSHGARISGRRCASRSVRSANTRISQVSRLRAHFLRSCPQCPPPPAYHPPALFATSALRRRDGYDSSPSAGRPFWTFTYISVLSRGGVDEPAAGRNHGRTPYAGALRSRLRRVCRWASFSFASVR
ncbi:hypothetical protein B0H14DRAFT_1633273 [Mycena olivaceomarginata]|nr:hypothetical protein B0H14DRAFT_1633273 [Mycena olivaceomarginata]